MSARAASTTAMPLQPGTTARSVSRVARVPTQERGPLAFLLFLRSPGQAGCYVRVPVPDRCNDSVRWSGVEHGSFGFRWPARLDRLDCLDGRKKVFRWHRCQQKQSCTHKLALFYGNARAEAPLLEHRELLVILPWHCEGVAYDLFRFHMLLVVPDSARRRRLNRRCRSGLWPGRHTPGPRRLD